MADFTAADLPDLGGRTAIVTGANSGVGLATTRALARAGARVVLAVRNLDKGRAAARTVAGDTEVRELDLADLRSVRAFAAAWSAGSFPSSELIVSTGRPAISEALRRVD